MKLTIVNALYRLWLITMISAGQTAWAAKELASKFKINGNTEQLVVVVVDDEQSVSGQLSTFYRKHDQHQVWLAHEITSDVVVGKNGVAWGKGLHPTQSGSQKEEGDGKAPSGVFSLTQAFGYLSELKTGLPYSQMTANDYCIDVNQSPYYNQIISSVDKGLAAIQGSSEPMRRDIHLGDMLYKKGIIIGHNPGNIAAAGSCIFMHIWRGQAQGTAGCTALPEPVFDKLLVWLESKKNPLLIVMTKKDYQQRQSAWQMPVLDSF